MESRPFRQRSRPAVGNDVVDLEDPRCLGKHRDERFVARVFAPEEREAIASAADPEQALWLHWAAKEAAYKVITKLLGAPPSFTHAAFVISSSRDEGSVRYGEHRVPFRVVQARQPLHVIAWHPPARAWLDEGARASVGVAPVPAARASAAIDGTLAARFSDRERRAVRSLASARVRLAARAQLQRILAVDERRLEIVCEVGAPGRSPPIVLLDGERTDADVSLSHHGRWVGWAVRVW
jgi:phosphopantetheine--protein transferase-like protein